MIFLVGKASRAVGHRTQFNTVDYKTSGKDNYLKQCRNSLPSEGAQITTTLDDLLSDIITSIAVCFHSKHLWKVFFPPSFIETMNGRYTAKLFCFF